MHAKKYLKFFSKLLKMERESKLIDPNILKLMSKIGKCIP